MNRLFLLSTLASSADGGHRLDERVAPSSEDQEVIDNLELLQNLEGARELEMLQELSLDR